MDMPAMDAARWGGPSGWRATFDAHDYGFAKGVAIERVDENGQRRRHGINLSHHNTNINGAMLVLKSWAGKTR